jgi:asparagine synthase (glutamine-hydrolysing)
MNDEEACYTLRELLCDVVERNPAEALLLSGGIDTSILAVVSSLEKAFTVTLGEAPDLIYAKKVAEMFSFEHHIIRITENEALEKIPDVIKILGTFDPAIPNDLAIYFGLKEAKEYGVESVMTGDGADEIFAGYSYMHALRNDELEAYIIDLSKVMQFSSNKLGRSIGVDIKQPFMDKELVDFALKIDPSSKVKKIGSVKYGKWILRKAFENDLPNIWRDKTPIEQGSGTVKLRALIQSKIPDDEFSKKIKEYGMKFINKEHLFFYEIYRDVVGEVPEAKGKDSCPFCNAAIRSPGAHCDVCGFSPPLPREIA